MKKVISLVALIVGLILGILWGYSMPKDNAELVQAAQAQVTPVYVTQFRYVPIPVIVNAPPLLINVCAVPKPMATQPARLLRVPGVTNSPTQVSSTVTSVVTTLTPSATTPAPTEVTPMPTTPTATPEPKCNRGYGNGEEGCDPGNSGGKGNGNSPYPPEKEVTNPKK